ncbi:hypothetical protein T09_10501 [Trichinella sp. T9]|nr:hypothetical protein T09_10501 [Trichinella sp. T9]
MMSKFSQLHAIFYVPADQNDVLNGSRCRHHCPNVPEGIKKCTRHDSVMGQVVIGSRVSLLVVGLRVVGLLVVE